MKENYPVKVHLITTMTMGDESERFEFKEDGQLVRLNNGQIYLRYLEHQEGQEIPVQFRLDDAEVQMRRRGPYQTRLTFQKGAETTTRYQTEYGIIHLGVETQTLVKKVDFDAHQGQLKVTYQLKNNQQVLGTYRIELQFEP